jgi:hypothetical protein
MNQLTAWILAAALHFAPPEKHPKFPGHGETAEEARARYEQIAQDIGQAVEGRKDAKSMAALALAWAVGESALAHDADVGPCYRQGAWKLRCDGGLAAGPWQLHEYMDRKAGERVTVAMIFADRARSARMVVRLLGGAFNRCTDLAPQDRLSSFGLGHCEAGNASVRARYKLWQEVRSWEPPKEDAASSTSMDNAIRRGSDAIASIVEFYTEALTEAEGALGMARNVIAEQSKQLDETRVIAKDAIEKIDSLRNVLRLLGYNENGERIGVRANEAHEDDAASSGG